MHTEAALVIATKPNTCELCKDRIEPGAPIIYIEGPPRGVRHLGCHVGRRRGVK